MMQDSGEAENPRNQEQDTFAKLYSCRDLILELFECANLLVLMLACCLLLCMCISVEAYGGVKT